MTGHTPETSKGGVSAKLVIGLVLLAVALVFVFSNLTSATLHFLGITFTAPGWVWFLALLAIGVVIGSMFPWFRPRKKPQK